MGEKSIVEMHSTSTKVTNKIFSMKLTLCHIK